MNKPIMVNECKFCGMRFGLDNNKCPKCASSNIGVVIPKYMEVKAEVSLEREVQVQKGRTDRKEIKRYRFSVLRIVVSTFGLLLLVCVVGSFAIGRFAMWMNRDSSEEITEVEESPNMFVFISTDEQVATSQYQKGLFRRDMTDEEILEVCKELDKMGTPLSASMYDWDNYAVASVIWDYYLIEKIWEQEDADLYCLEYNSAELLNYYFKYWDFETNSSYTTEEKERLRKYITRLREDVEKRWNLTKEEWGTVYTELKNENGIIENEKLTEFVNQSDLWMSWVDNQLKKAETLGDAAWGEKMFPIMNVLFELEKDEEICHIYDKAYEEERFIVNNWEHERFAFYMMRMHDLEWIWPKLDAGETVREYWYVEILHKYLLFMDYADSEYFTKREKARIKPYYDNVEKYATTIWDFSEGDFKELFEKNQTATVTRDEIEKLVQEWMLQIEQEEMADMSETDG